MDSWRQKSAELRIRTLLDPFCQDSTLFRIETTRNASCRNSYDNWDNWRRKIYYSNSIWLLRFWVFCWLHQLQRRITSSILVGVPPHQWQILPMAILVSECGHNFWTVRLAESRAWYLLFCFVRPYIWYNLDSVRLLWPHNTSNRSVYQAYTDAACTTSTGDVRTEVSYVGYFFLTTFSWPISDFIALQLLYFWIDGCLRWQCCCKGANGMYLNSWLSGLGWLGRDVHRFNMCLEHAD